VLPLERVHDIVHREELVAREPEHELSVGHLVERGLTGDGVSVRGVELDVRLSAVWESRQLHRHSRAGRLTGRRLRVHECSRAHKKQE
jgi:hypothetical protein